MNGTWTADRCAAELLGSRRRLIRTLPAVIGAASQLSPTQREEVVDDAISELTVGYGEPIADRDELDRVFWAYARNLVAHALDGRHDTVRGRFSRAPVTALEDLGDGSDPAEQLSAAQDLRLVREFATTLDEDEAAAFAVKWSGEREAGERTIAKTLGIARADARRLDRAIGAKLNEFALLFATGRLCSDHGRRMKRIALRRSGAQTDAGPVRPGAAAGSPSDVAQARAHLAHCLTCQADYKAQLAAVRSAAFGRKVAGVLPIPVALGVSEQDRMRDWIAEFGTRHADKAATATELALASIARGYGSLAGRIAACVTGGVAVVTACIATGVIPLPLPDWFDGNADRAEPNPPAVVRATPTPSPTADPRIASLPAATPTPRPTRKRKPASSSRSSRGKTQGGTGPSSQEETPASPASKGSLPGGQSEFGPSSAQTTPAPAPVPAAPGASEFGP